MIVRVVGPLDQDPLTPLLDEPVQQHHHIGKHKPADVEAEEFGGVARGELEADVGWR
jgi:hypothetical protein